MCRGRSAGAPRRPLLTKCRPLAAGAFSAGILLVHCAQQRPGVRSQVRAPGRGGTQLAHGRLRACSSLRSDRDSVGAAQ